MPTTPSATAVVVVGTLVTEALVKWIWRTIKNSRGKHAGSSAKPVTGMDRRAALVRATPPGDGVLQQDHGMFVYYSGLVSEWIANYRQTVGEFHVRSRAQPGFIRQDLPDKMPEQGESMKAILLDFDQYIVPNLTHWESPRFYAYFKPHSAYASILGETLSAAVNNMGFSWISSPSCTELETLMCDWVAKAFDFPEKFLSTSNTGGGVIQGSAGEAAVVCMIGAMSRWKKALAQSSSQSVHNSLAVYVSDHTHSIIEKAVIVLGIPSENLKVVKTTRDNSYSMMAKDLETTIQDDLNAGYRPFFVCSTFGTTSAGSVDSIKQIGEVAKKYGAWHHVDAAYGGSYCILPEFQRLLTHALQNVDSIAINAHKKMAVNFDCTLMWVSDKMAITEALTLHPEYLRNAATESGAVVDYKDWQIPLGRRFRSLKLWFVLRSFGVSGMREYISAGISLKQYFVGIVEKDGRFEVHYDSPFALVTFRLKASNESNQALLQVVNNSGVAFITHTILSGQFVLRMAFGGWEQTIEGIDTTWREISSVARRILRDPEWTKQMLESGSDPQ